MTTYPYEDYEGFGGKDFLRKAHSELVKSLMESLRLGSTSISDALIHIVVCQMADTDANEEALDLIARIAGFDK